MARRDSSFDVIIVGGGIAGMSAALVLGRCRRRVLVCDHGRPRNLSARGVHAFLSRDGIPPLELRRIAREQLQPYGQVEVRDVEVTSVHPKNGGYEAVLLDGRRETCRKLLLATGLRDELPEIENIQEFYGKSVHHCPICDGWEHRDERIGVYGRGGDGCGLAIDLLAWSSRVILCTDGEDELTEAQCARLARHGIEVRRERARSLEGENGMLQRLIFADGSHVELDALFFGPSQEQASALSRRIGCALDPELNEVKVAANCEVGGRPGLYVVGNASEGTQLAIAAAAEAAVAAHAIQAALIAEDFP